VGHKALDASRAAQAGSPESLRRADSLRAGGAAACAEAMTIYRDNAAAIDPATAEGELRVRWLLDSRRALAQEFEELLLRAAERAGDEGTRFAASIACAQFPQRRGDFASAAVILRRGLASVRGSQSRRETSAAMTLSGVLRAQHRTMDALVVARRASRLAERLGPSGAVAAALVHVGATLVEIGEHGGFDAVAARLEAVLPALDPHELASMRRALHRYRAESALERGDRAAAGREIALLDALPLESWMRDLVAAEDAHRRARLSALRGEFAEALAVTAANHRPEGARGRMWFEWSALDVACRARRGEPSSATAFLDELDRTGAETLGTGAALRIAVLVAEALGSAPGEDETSSRAHGFAAEMLAARIAEIDECTRDLDELSTSVDDDRAFLAAIRARIVRDHESLLAALR
jgi:hypothetical protein